MVRKAVSRVEHVQEVVRGQRLDSPSIMGTRKSGRQLVILFRIIDAVLIV